MRGTNYSMFWKKKKKKRQKQMCIQIKQSVKAA